MSARGHILIAGVGNLLRSDDGVGVHAVRELLRSPMDGVTVVDLGTAVLHGLAFLESARQVLIIDAARGGGLPGTVYLFDANRPSESGTIVSMHAMGLRDATCLLPPGTPVPEFTVLGVEPASLGYGSELSELVAAVLPTVVSLAQRTVARWLREADVRHRLSGAAMVTPSLFHTCPRHN